MRDNATRSWSARRIARRAAVGLGVMAALLAGTARPAPALTTIVSTEALQCGYDASTNRMFPTASVHRSLSVAGDERVSVTLTLFDGPPPVAAGAVALDQRSTGLVLADGSVAPSGVYSVPVGATRLFRPPTVPFGESPGPALIAGHDYTIRVRVFDFGAGDFNFSEWHCNAATSPPSNAVAPRILGVPALGSQLTGDVGAWDGDGVSFAQRWLACDAAGGSCNPIPGETGLSHVVAVSDLPSGGAPRTMRLEVTATNAGGSSSAFSAPIDIGDSDGDALLDYWERTGDLDGDGALDLDLPAMGAKRDHTDVFVELDAMQNHSLSQAAIGIVVAAFAAAPVTNFDGVLGIALHVDNGPGSVMNAATGDTWGALSEATSSIPEIQMLGQSNGEYDWTAFDTIKSANFTTVRSRVFHYALSGHEYASSPPGSSGISRNAPDLFSGASDFLVTLGPACAGGAHCSGTVGQQAGTFMHELGHNLGLGHGGGDSLNRKPNYLSIMNYDFQFSGLVVNGNAGTYDYSRYGPESLSVIQEAALDETTGLGVAGGPVTALTMLYRCPGGAARTWQLSVGPAIDWTCDGVIGSGPFAIDLNLDGGMTPVASFEDWSHIEYGGGAVGDAGAVVTLPPTTPTVDPPISVLLASAELLSTPSATAVTYTGSQSAQYSDVATLSARLAQPGLPSGAGVPGRQLDFALGTQAASAGPTDVAGNATTSLVVTQPPGSATSVGASFGGGGGYAPSSASASFSITKESCTLGYSGDIVSAPLALTTLAADLGEADASLGDRSGKAVAFTAIGVADPAPRTFTGITDASGRAAVSAPLPADVYAVTASFDGDAFYAQCATPGETLLTVEAAAAKVTGGGWISIGTGRTSFGFNAIPQAGGSWKGQLQVRSHSGKNRFHARVVTTLTASSTTATWSGVGSWNGEPNFTYTVSVVDNGLSDPKKDAVGIVIAKQGGGTVYTTSGLQPIKGGNLTVH